MSEDPQSWQLYIDGEWTSADEHLESTNPTTGETVARGAKGDREDAVTAIAAANDAQAEWAALSQHERGAYLRDAADALEAQFGDLVTLISEEMGKVGGWAAGEVKRAIDLLNYYAEVGRDEGGIAPPSAQESTRTYTEREPWGTAGIVTPWNYPIAIPVWKLAPALVSGNTAVFKPASATPAVAAKLVEAFEEADLPAGVLNFVPGSGSEVGDEIITAAGTDVVSFTGSYDVGHRVHETAAEHGKRVQCEMGGKNPIVVDETADLDHAVELTVGGAFSGLAGQACTATSRAVVFESVYDEFLERLTERVENIAVGDPTDRSTEMGPKVSESELESDLEYIELGRESDARLVTGGGRPEGEAFADGNFVEPTVFADVDPEARIAQEEIFGPVLAVIPVAGFDEAMDVANGVDYGLSASLATNRLDRSERFASESETGIVKINQKSTGVELQMPFGGRKQSSSETFKEQGRTALEFYTHEKAVYVTHYDV